MTSVRPDDVASTSVQYRDRWECFVFHMQHCYTVLNKHKNKTWVSEFEGCKISRFPVQPPDVKIFCISIKPLAELHIYIYHNKNYLKLVECEE